jgi:hypothetical protein
MIAVVITGCRRACPWSTGTAPALARVDLDRRAQRPRQALEAALDDVVVVLAVEILDVQRDPADCAKAWNHSLNSSVSISPSFGRVKFTFQTR